MLPSAESVSGPGPVLHATRVTERNAGTDSGFSGLLRVFSEQIGRLGQEINAATYIVLDGRSFWSGNAAMVGCLLCLVAGAWVATWAPVFQFAVGLIVTAGAGAAVAIAVAGAPVGGTLLWAAGLYACAQVGYVLGLLAMAVASVRPRRRKAKARDEELPPLREPLLK